jgi:hypothetical protein
VIEQEMGDEDEEAGRSKRQRTSSFSSSSSTSTSSSSSSSASGVQSLANITNGSKCHDPIGLEIRKLEQN